MFKYNNLKNYLFFIFLLINPVFASESYKKWLKDMKKEALDFGISEDTYNSALLQLNKPNSKVIKYYNNQPEFKITFDKYYSRNINKNRILKGRELLKKHYELLKSIEKNYSVPPEIIVSIWGIETNYGSYIGNFYIIDALATLAYQSKRKFFFKKELFNALLIIEKKYINSNLMIGSWAGAMGQGQFMPSSYLQYAVDYNKDNKIDLWNSYEDIFASIGNYLKKHGWNKNFYWSLDYGYKLNLDADKVYTSSDILKEGINSKLSSYFKSTENIYIKTTGHASNLRYFLVSKNFNIIKKYNNSDFYALVVGELANKIKEN